jgi:protocatechuate 3,4-dioxygenase beta subunit
MTVSRMTRRGLLGALSATALASSPAARAATCAFTPPGPEGPFYPIKIKEDDADLTLVRGAEAGAKGEVIEVTGRVLNARCRPLASAVIDIWQANAAGRYDHPSDSANPAPLDANFQGYARLIADARGEFRFRTIKPGSYPVFDNWERPPHIHFKVTPVLDPYLITQMYFAGDPLNADDRLFNAIDPAARHRVEVDFAATNAEGIPVGTFDLTVGAA